MDAKIISDDIRQQVIEILHTVPCTFWACDGPEAPMVWMKTCNLCQAIKLLEGEDI